VNLALRDRTNICLVSSELELELPVGFKVSLPWVVRGTSAVRPVDGDAASACI
jgi:hypothetical protein